jgi:DNA invertase Pin-like site-specific DNA recombinase
MSLSTDFLNILVYTRVSTEEQESGHSLASQRSQIEALPDFPPPDTLPVHFFTDTASGSDPNRPGLRSMLRTLPDCPCLIVYKIDRLARDQATLWKIADKIHRKKGIILEASTGFRSDTTTGRLMLGILSAVAEFELSLIRERTLSGIATARALGKHIGSPSYGNIVQEGVLQTCPEEDDHVRLIIDLRSQGLSLRQIATTLNTMQIPTKKRGLRWYASTIRQILIRLAKAALS